MHFLVLSGNIAETKLDSACLFVLSAFKFLKTDRHSQCFLFLWDSLNMR